jgi:hypothetical protein
METTRKLAQNLTLPGATPGQGVTISGPVGYRAGNTLGEVISNIFPYLFVFAGIGLLLMLIMGGFELLTSAGDPKKLESGRQRITYAIVGFLIVFLAFWLVQLVALIFGITEFQLIFRNPPSGGGRMLPI